VNTLVLVDPTEEVRPLAATLEDAGYEVRTAQLSGLLDDPAREDAAVLLFNLLGRTDATTLRTVMRSSSLPQGVATLAIVRSEQLGSLDFSLGFDDFVVFPAITEELVARIRKAIWLKSGVEGDNTLHAGDLMIDLGNYKVYLAGRPVELTYKEYELLRFLATNRDKVFTREALLNRVWGYDFYGGARTVDVHIRRLRSKLEDGTHTFIETVRNVGYRFHTG
jgi:two-component system, OmpR family, alkaline phosphatase synthesis response regulator PhoP